MGVRNLAPARRHHQLRVGERRAIAQRLAHLGLSIDVPKQTPNHFGRLRILAPLRHSCEDTGRGNPCTFQGAAN